ncbi:hypothetical protein L7F22_027407 [Adiantum nelumboides]|nr:hypothetical protein [Adiantum nelumboides]
MGAVCAGVKGGAGGEFSAVPRAFGGGTASCYTTDSWKNCWLTAPWGYRWPAGSTSHTICDTIEDSVVLGTAVDGSINGRGLKDCAVAEEEAAVTREFSSRRLASERRGSVCVRCHIRYMCVSNALEKGYVAAGVQEENPKQKPRWRLLAGNLAEWKILAIKEENAIFCAQKFPGKEHVWKAWDSGRRRRGRRSARRKPMHIQLLLQ